MGGPFAFRSQLGWCVVGPCTRQSTAQISCNRIQVRDVCTNQVAAHEFVYRTEVKDLSIAEQLRDMYLHDFNENSSEKMALSVDDRAFIEIMQKEGKLINGHYHLPLPLKKREPGLPDNKCMAVKRLKSVGNRIQRDNCYREDYNKFMSNLISRGHAQKVDPKKVVQVGWKWYVPHHGVYHPVNKKFRIVMDCSARFMGMSLNEELIQGPDNTNRLEGVLLRFRKHNVPFMGDLEQMFFQIFVPVDTPGGRVVTLGRSQRSMRCVFICSVQFHHQV